MFEAMEIFCMIFRQGELNQSKNLYFGPEKIRMVGLYRIQPG